MKPSGSIASIKLQIPINKALLMGESYGNFAIDNLFVIILENVTYLIK